MRRFALLYAALDDVTSTNAKTTALVDYFRDAPPADAAWALACFAGRRPKRLVRSTHLRQWAAEAAGIEAWLFEECYQQVGDLAETIALLIPEPDAAHADDRGLAAWIEETLIPLGSRTPDAQRTVLTQVWTSIGGLERFCFTKLMTGAFRVGASEKLVVKALAKIAEIDETVIAHRLMGAWEPTPEFFTALLARDTQDTDASRPYPFYLASPLEDDADALGAPSDWHIEWKWDGIRVQVVRRSGTTWLWSRGEELLDGRFPELEAATALLPEGTVIDGELLGWKNGRPLDFLQLQKRINRRAPGKKLLTDVPVRIVAYDLLEYAGDDLRAQPQHLRRAALDTLVDRLPASVPITRSPLLAAATWDDVRALRLRAREHHAEGLMLKRADAPYGVGRKRGSWWKWKVQPLSVDAVLINAQAGHGRRSGLFTDFTFGIWDGDTLVPFAKAYSGLTDAEMREVDSFIKQHTLEKFGPVRAVEPRLVFELHFEGIQRSSRHKSGIAVRFPRIARWRTDKPAAEADTLQTVRALLGPEVRDA